MGYLFKIRENKTGKILFGMPSVGSQFILIDDTGSIIFESDRVLAKLYRVVQIYFGVELDFTRSTSPQQNAPPQNQQKESPLPPFDLQAPQVPKPPQWNQ